MEPLTQTSKDSLQIPTKTKILSAELDVQLQPAETCDVTCVYSLSYSDAVVISAVLVVQRIGIAWNCTLQSTCKCQLDSLVISPFSAHANRPTSHHFPLTSHITVPDWEHGVQSSVLSLSTLPFPRLFAPR